MAAIKKSEVLDLAAIIASLFIQYGLPEVLRMIEAWKVEEVTPEMINGLRALVKPPEEYFPDFKKA